MPQSRELQAAQVLPADAVRRAAEARLAKLRAGSRPQEVAGAKAALKAAQAALTRLQRGNRPEEIQRPQAALQVEQEELAKLRAGPRPQEIAQAEAAVREAQSDAEAAAKEVERVGALFTDGLASGKDRERAGADRTAAQAHLATAQEQVKLLREGTRAEEIRAQEAKVRAAEADLKLAQAGARQEELDAQQAKVEEAQQALQLLESGSRPEEIREAEADLHAAEATLTQAKAGHWQVTATGLTAQAARSKSGQAAAELASAQVALGKAQVVCPVTGVVGDVFANRGEVVDPAAPLFEGVNVDALRVVSQAPTRYQAQLRLGLAATVTLPHLPGVSFRTTVSTIGALNNTDTGLVPLELLVPNGSHELKEGRAADVSLVLTAHEQALQVPLAAVFGRAGESFVYVVDSESQVHERRVELGVERDEKAHQRAS
ncbi:MAG: hypothetical protein AUJ96_21950 [Armatimonadetes bacterium CG2_30_66_41]|nr:MAG: hypothetical protein AUJ96_21950 [Armatimonadetes bacterium CG2_30_66_41]